MGEYVTDWFSDLESTVDVDDYIDDDVDIKTNRIVKSDIHLQ